MLLASGLHDTRNYNNAQNLMTELRREQIWKVEQN